MLGLEYPGIGNEDAAESKAGLERIPYIAIKPNFPGSTNRGKANIPRHLVGFKCLPKIGFAWVCFRQKLALDWLWALHAGPLAATNET
jgi:hypothetical protein